MRVVSNTSPLNYLLLIDAVTILPSLFEAVWVPPQVLAELADPAAPEHVQQFARTPPAWLVNHAPANAPPLPNLHIGETYAIALASEVGADRLLIDDWRGREQARELGLTVMGTLGVLDLAAEHGLLDLREALDRLRQTNFRVNKKLVAFLLERASQRKADK